jgi:cytochrome c-type biogenesis protein CcmH/NrfG
VFKVLAYAILALSLFFVLLVNFYIVWMVTAAFAAGVLVYKISLNRAMFASDITPDSLESTQASSWRVPALSAVVLIVAIIFSITSLLKADPVASFLTAKFNISHLEARPSWDSTLNVAGKALAINPILGTGPNRFSSQWIRSRPSSISESPFWNVDFNSGIGILPTFAVTTGALGILVWLAFLTLFAASGLKAIFSSAENPFEAYLTTSAFFAATYGWVMMIFYTPGIVPIALTFVFTGLFIAMLAQRGFTVGRVISFNGSPALSFVVSSVLIVSAIAALVSGYLLTTRSVAEAARVKGLIAFAGGGSIGSVKEQLERSVAFYDSDRSRRDLAELGVQELNQFLSDQGDLTGEEAITKFRNLLGNAIEHARRAGELNPSDYQNWSILGDVYASVVPVGIEGAYDSALTAYNQAYALNPTNPQISLKLARLEAFKGNAAEARNRVNEAISKKSNYSEAAFFLTQLEIQEGNIAAALDSAKSASLLSPNDPLVFFQLGLLHYHSADYQAAINALERAVGLNDQYANARYFLGLSYSNVGRGQDAVAQFEVIEQFNPDNKEVKFILSNLRAGRAPFTDAAPEIAQPPEDREELPIDEQ